MKIAIDARLISESGVGRYIRNLLSELAKLDTQNQYFILLLKKDFNVIDLPDSFKKVKANFKWYGFEEQLKMPGLLTDLEVDLVHFPHFNVPVLYRGKYVVTIHDLIHQKVQMRRATTHDPLTYKIKQWGYNLTFKTALKRSKAVITVSDFVADELKNDWGVDDKKIVVTKEAVDEKIIKLAKMPKTKQQELLKKLGVTPPYIFYIGNAHPHKNVEGLIKAFEQLRPKYQYLKLVLAGHDHYFWQRLKSETKNKDVIFAGHVSDEEMVALYKNAQVYVLPSLEEGFGIPLLEAFACEVPVAASKVASLPEVGGDAAVYFNPKNIPDMTKVVGEVMNSLKLRNELIKKGLKRYPEFSWKKLAKETLSVYNLADAK